MWRIIRTDDEIFKFMEEMQCFHDACIKEISYIS